MMAVVALVVAAAIAALGHLLWRLSRMTRLDAVVVTAVLAELAKKLSYIAVGQPEKALSLALAAPLLLTVGWWLGRLRGVGDVRRLAAPAGWLAIWLGTLALFTFLNPEGSPLVLASYLVAWLWIPGALGLLGGAGRWTYRLLWVAVIVAAVNHVVGGDPLWSAYRAVAEPVSIGSRYTPDVGYSGSIFSSQTEFGAFTLAATGLLLAAPRRPRGLLPLSIAAAVLAGQRYTMLGLVLFWILFAWGRVSRLRPWQAVVAVLAYSPVQDALGRRILDGPLPLATSSDPFVARLFTVGTLSARVGFTELWSTIFSQYWLWGIGLVDVFSATAVYPDDRHNLILWLVLRGGLLALLSYFAFVWIHFRRFARAEPAVARPAMAFLVAALVMSMGGPQATSSWFFLPAGIFFHLAGPRQASGRRVMEGPVLGAVRP